MKKILRVVAAGMLLMALSSPALAQDSLGLANPASVFCTACGGSVETVSSESGETGYCTFSSGFMVEEWSWFYLFFGGQPTLY